MTAKIIDLAAERAKRAALEEDPALAALHALARDGGGESWSLTAYDGGFHIRLISA